ncbi:MAG TPA: YciI family protein [Candidatus Binatia bacterium]|nr:YciI family protein [Candidatus Binatia bacterium]
MKFILLIYDEEKAWAKLSQSEQQKIMAEYRALGESLKASGHYLSGSQLAPVASAASVRVRQAKRMVTDGPFAETREQLGGYFLIEARDRDEAIAIAQRVPSARMGTVEVRPLV